MEVVGFTTLLSGHRANSIAFSVQTVFDQNYLLLVLFVLISSININISLLKFTIQNMNNKYCGPEIIQTKMRLLFYVVYTFAKFRINNNYFDILCIWSIFTSCSWNITQK